MSFANGHSHQSQGLRSRIGRVLTICGAAAMFTVAGLSQNANAQMNPIPSHNVKVEIDSGILINGGQTPEVVWNDVIEVEGAQWLRVEFSRLELAVDPMTGRSSTIRLVSMLDGGEQTLNAETARQWQNASAYFNGDAVAIELVALPGGARNHININHVVAGDIPDQVGIETICDGVDDRALSDDKRAGRSLPAGCTAWIIDDRNHCMLTAGHCQAYGNTTVEFNVPLSNSNGSIVHPGPEDQYAVDPASVQYRNNGIGDDYSYFGCFANSQTGLTAYEAQGDFFELDFPQQPQGNDEIRITGYGTVAPPVDPKWNQVQKTHAGPYWSFSGSEVGYRTDTTGGNSGSPVIFEPNGKAIGIHTHGGCGNGSGNNWGTGVNNAGLQYALANPKGVCKSRDCLYLDVTNLRAGESATFTIEDGTRGSTVAILWSTSRGSFSYSGGDWCVDFGIQLPNKNPQARIIAQGFFDTSGMFSRNVFVPGNTRGMDLVFQAAVKATCPDECMSNVLEATVQ